MEPPQSIAISFNEAKQSFILRNSANSPFEQQLDPNIEEWVHAIREIAQNYQNTTSARNWWRNEAAPAFQNNDRVIQQLICIHLLKDFIGTIHQQAIPSLSFQQPQGDKLPMPPIAGIYVANGHYQLHSAVYNPTITDRWKNTGIMVPLLHGLNPASQQVLRHAIQRNSNTEVVIAGSPHSNTRHNYGSQRNDLPSRMVIETRHGVAHWLARSYEFPNSPQHPDAIQTALLIETYETLDPAFAIRPTEISNDSPHVSEISKDLARRENDSPHRFFIQAFKNLFK